MKRRSIITLTLLGLILLSTPVLSAQGGDKVSHEAGRQPDTTAPQQTQADSVAYQLITLPYATNALEPVISERTVKLHHGKHLAS